MKKKGWLMKFSLLSISLVLTSAGSIAANIPEMQKSFPEVPLSSIELLTTIPALTVLIFVILSSFIANYIGEKKTVLLGLLIALISGVIPAFSDNFFVILIARAGMGAGFGLFNSLAVSMIGNFFEGDERARLIGFQSAFQSLGSAVLALLAGQLLKINWHTSFLIYLVILPIIFLFALFVPDVPKQIEKVEKTKTNSSMRFDVRIIGYTIFLFLLIIVFSASNVKLAQLLVENNLGTATDAANISSLQSIGGMLAGFAFGNVFKIFRKYTLSVALFLMAAAYVLFGFSGNLMVATIAAVMNGIAFSLIVPFLFDRVNDIASNETKTSSTSLLLVGANLASSISPYGLLVLGILSGTNTVNGIYFVGAALLAVMVFVTGALVSKKENY